MADAFGQGFIQAPLIKQLQNILQQYSDDGQILKELIQNAEDAGATTIKFMYDKSCYGDKDGLYEPGLGAHQGPALYAYNDAVFSDDDWEGIRKIQDSNKAEDPLKVGRFGLGFKSVFHMTDLPGILSGNQVGYLDPQEQYFTKPQETTDRHSKKSRRRDIPTSSFAWNLNSQLINDYPNQFAPFMHRIFGIHKNTFKTGVYNGTLFRFPFRREKSKISKIIYNDRKVEILQQEMEREAHFLLLFLKNIETIEFYEKSKKQENPKLNFRIAVSESRKLYVTEKRNRFLKELRERHVACQKKKVEISTSYLLETIYENHKRGKQEQETKQWLVTQHCGIQDENERCKNLPLVGVALPLQEENTKGHVFCFLPMPIDSENETGLDIHINGYFAVDQNRKHLKWPSRGQSLKHSTDEQLKWNWFLLSEMVPVAMVKLLAFAISLQTDVENIYKIFPKKNELQEHWKPLCERFCLKVQDIECLYVSARKSWHIPKECYVIENIEPTLVNVIKKVTVKGGLYLVEAPTYVKDCVKSKTNNISPENVRNALMKIRNNFTVNEMRCLVSYFVKYATLSSIIDLKLLPLLDNTAQMFKMPTFGNYVYLETKECPRSLIPGNQMCILNCELSDPAYSSFHQIAVSGQTQLRLLMPDDVPQLIKIVAQDIRTYTPNKEPMKVEMQWLRQIWEFIAKHHINSLKKYVGLPIVPINNIRWETLEESIPYVMERTRERSLSDLGIQSSTLKKLGIILVGDHNCLLTSPQIEHFISPPTVPGILNALSKVQGNLCAKIGILDNDEKILLRDVFSNSFNLSRKHLELLRSCPLFQCYKVLGDSEEKWCSSYKILGCAYYNYSIPLPVDVKVGKLHNCERFADLLSVKEISVTSLLLKYIFPCLGDFRRSDIRKLMRYVLREFSTHYKKDANIVQDIRNISFMNRKREKWVKPSDLVDPSNATVMNVFKTLDIFPCGEFAEKETIEILSSYGILKQISEDEILQMALYINNTECYPTLYTEAMVFFNYINQHTFSLTGKVLKKMKELAWVPAKTKKPQHLPSTLNWFGEKNMTAKPSEIYASKYELIVSSVSPVIPDDPNTHLAELFKWTEKPAVSVVLKQLQNVIKAWKRRPSTDIHSFPLIVKEIYQYMNDQDLQQVHECFQQCTEWIWTGKSFTKVKNAVLNEPSVCFEPYIYHFPSEYQNCWKSRSLEILHIKKYITLEEVLFMVKEYHDSNCETFTQRDVKLCVSILHAIRENNIEISESTPIPVKSDTSMLVLKALKSCVYSDQETGKKNIVFDDVLDCESGDELYEIHQDIPPQLAKDIGVPSLISRYLDAEPLNYGQSEPLTRRIKSLLEEYTDGSSILKELIQNADDAAASEISFIYDSRDFTQTPGMLIDENMRSLQGPALLCHNNAVFSKEDFVNIVKISAATKIDKADKIGNFGLGFNAVYNLTDAPSFVSGEHVVIFDPQMKYLGDALKDPNQPGIKLHLTKHRNRIKRLKSQFEPFQNVMKCDILNSQSYPGTLFRFPLRTSSSEISAKCYSLREVKALFSIFKELGPNLLLFTQNVQRINVFEITKKNMTKKGYIAKSPVHLIKSISDTPTLQAPSKKSTSSAKWEKEFHILKHTTKPNSGLSRNHFIMKTDTYIQKGLLFTETKQSTNHWSIGNVLGKVSNTGLLVPSKESVPIGSIAIKLQIKATGKFKVIPLDECQVFCFLPLPIYYQLPFHLNGNFAVTANRKHLVEQDLHDKKQEKAEWNQTLMNEILSDALFKMLSDMVNNEDFIFEASLQTSIYMLFPKIREEHYDEKNLLHTFVKSFYGKIIRENVPIFPGVNKWTSFRHSKFLHPELQQVHSKTFQRLKEAISEECCIYYERITDTDFVDIPYNIINEMEKMEYGSKLSPHLITREQFYRDIFLPCVSQKREHNTEKLLMYALLECNNEIDEYLKTNNCIPVSSDARFLMPGKLVDPESDLKQLYDHKDGPFPVWLQKNSHLKLKIKISLGTLGMRDKILARDEIISRANTIKNLDYIKGLKRCKAVLKMLSQISQIRSEHSYYLFQKLKSINFLPVLQKPTDWFLKWCSDVHEGKWISTEDSYIENQANIVGCSEIIAKFPHKSEALKKRLGYCEKEVRSSHIDKQLKEISEFMQSRNFKHNNYDKKKTFVQEIMNSIYYILADSKMSHIVWTKYAKESIILVDCEIHGLKFVTPKMCASDEKFGYHPYLYGISSIKDMFPSLIQNIGLKEKFDVESFISALSIIAKTEKKIQDKDTLWIVRRMVMHLACIIRGKELAEIVKLHGCIYLPDSKGNLINASDLCFNNCPWYESPERSFLHPDIPFSEAACLGVNTFIQEMLSGCQYGIPFGQHEELTNRIKRILQGYPCDKEILYELLQNADDAGAHEIHFILDHRNHQGKKLFSPEWENLQGPALLVYNDKPFTEADLEGIQKLGEGSKSNDPLTTGKYGVGFNCVYHLTDTPLFQTQTETGDRVLIALDPQCRYVSGSTKLFPGQRFKRTDDIAQIFPDVFKCFDLPVNKEGGTLFRFPLRSSSIARSSEISRNAVEVTDIKQLFGSFAETLENCLLFLSCVRRITLSEIESNGKLNILTSVKGNITELDLQKLETFKQSVKRNCRKPCKLQDIDFEQCYYEMEIESDFTKATWLVVQQVGIRLDWKHIECKVIDTYEERDASLLPRGGVSYCLDYKEKISRTRSSKYATSSFYYSMKEGHKRKKLYCFLPLPISTEYCMQLNGNFMLDHESRRNLWKNEKMGGFNVEWNKLIFGEVIADCYVTAMMNIKERISLQGSYNRLLEELKNFNLLFPKIHKQDFYLSYLQGYIYKHLIRQNACILPVLQRHSLCKSHIPFSYNGRGNIEWSELRLDSGRKVFFDDLEFQRHFQVDVSEKEMTTEIGQKEQYDVQKVARFRNVLHNSHYPMTSLKNYVLNKLNDHVEKSETLSIEFVNPDSIVMFYLEKALTLQLPKAIKDTVFVDNEALIDVLDYCKKELMQNLNKLPFLLSGDGVLHTFSEENRLLLSEYSDLIPSQQSRFADKLYLKFKHKKAYECQMQTYFAAMGINELEQLLHYELPVSDFHGKDKVVSIDFDQDDSLLMFLQRLWAFIYSCAKNSDFNQEEVQQLGKWCVLPVQIEEGSYRLWPVCRSSELIKPDDHSKISKICRQWRLPEPYIPENSYYMEKAVDKIVANFRSPISILHALGKALERRPQNFHDIQKSSCLKVLEYFDESVHSLKSKGNAVATLKKLPFYESKDSSLRKLSNCQSNIFTVPNSIPDSINWTDANENVYLHRYDSMDNLYSFIEVKHLDVESAYADHILNFFGNFEENERCKHLIFLRKLVQENELDGHKDKNTRILNALKNIPILCLPDGTLTKVSDFYDPNVTVFKTFENNFPNHPLNDPGWIDFFKKIGLVAKLTSDLIVKYAKLLESNAKDTPKADIQSLTEKCKILCKEMCLNHKDLLSPVTTQIKDLKFIPAYNASHNLKILLEPPTTNTFICYHGASLQEHETLLWTQVSILPDWSTPESKDICQNLGVITVPSLSDVIENTDDVCSKLKQSGIKTKEISTALISFCCETFTYIMNFGMQEDLSSFQNIPCIPILDGTELVKPSQIYKSSNIPQKIAQYLLPYLSPLPNRFVEFMEFLKKVGATEHVSPEQYSSTLCTIYNESKGEEIEPNEEKTIVAALKGLFKLSEEDNTLSSVAELYLLSSDKRMLPSCDVLYMNNLSLKSRVTKLILPRLYDLANKEMVELSAQSIDKALLSLPDNTRPKLISEVVIEKIEQDCLSTKKETEQCFQLAMRMMSDEFCNGIIRIIRSNSTQMNANDEKDLLEKVEKLKTIKFFELDCINSFLEYDGERLQQSELEKMFLIQQNEVIIVYLSMNSTIMQQTSKSFINEMCEIVNSIMGDKVDTFKKSAALQEVFTCEVEDIDARLDELGIPPYQISGQTVSTTGLAKPGEYVPLKFHHLLHPVNGLLRRGEIVGYEVFDPFESADTNIDEENQSSHGVFRYAQVVEIISDVSYYIDARYKVSLGDEEMIEAHASELYRFCRKMQSKETFEEIKCSITKKIEHAFKLEELYKRKIIKQLWLQWHPDKNPECSDLATKIFQWIQSEIKRLEMKDEPDSANGSTEYPRNSYWNRFNRYYSRRAKCHGENISSFKYSEEFKSDEYFTPPRYYKKNPQPIEARRWLKQARFDLEAVMNDMNSFHEWACMKCHQAAEKALKATQFAKDSGLKDNQHALYRLCNAIDDEDCKNNARSLESLLGGSTAMRYPDQHSGGRVPHDVFTNVKAQQAKLYATQIVNKCERFVARN